MVTTITHAEISATTAGKLGGNATAESVSNTVKKYYETTFELMKEKGPKTSKDTLLVETPGAGYQVNYHESGVKKNPDGTEEKIGPNRKVKIAVPNALLKLINADLIKLVVDVAKAAKAA